MVKVNSRGELLPFQVKKALDKLSDIEHKREYVRHTLDKPIQSHRPLPVRAGQDPLEQRASQTIQGSILERIVYKKLEQILGPEGHRWKFKQGILGTRQFVGGFEIDFVINNPIPIALEVQGLFWHGPVTAYVNAARALVIMGLGYDYKEILEWEIMNSDEFLEQRIRDICQLY